ncbi:hypothetical protein GCM10020000_11140 [Streptomyces olivoverticillatus]
MIKTIRPLLRCSSYSGALFACCGALASLLLLPFAALPALAWPSAAYEVQIVLTLLVWAVLIGVVGLARTTRRVLIVCAPRMLGGAVAGSRGRLRACGHRPLGDPSLAAAARGAGVGGGRW